MKKLLLLFLSCSSFVWSQTNFSDNWEDFYSYNNVKDFIKVENKIFAIVDNAVFTYDIISQEIEKLSSVQGLSGKTTSSIYYDNVSERLIIGYETGLLEIVDVNGNITIANDIERLSIIGNKQINDIIEYNRKLYLATPFAIVVYDIDNLQFGDTYFIGAGSSEVNINEIAFFNERIYAATVQGIFSADVNNPNLIDFNNWIQPQNNFIGNFRAVTLFNNKLYVALNSNFYEITSSNTLQLQATVLQEIINIQATENAITLTSENQAVVYDSNILPLAVIDPIENFNFELNNAFAEDQIVYLGTTEYGILKKGINDANFVEIHPKGPSNNDIFSINTQNNNLWVVYGGYDAAFTPIGNASSYDHFNGETWVNIPFNLLYPARDLVNVTVDPNNENKVYISSWSQNDPSNLTHTGGLLVVENDEPQSFFNETNSGLESIVLPSSPNYKSIRVNGTAFDNQGNLWVTNGLVANRLKKLAPNGAWSSFDLNSLIDNNALGLTELAIDRTNTIWIGSRRNGLLAYNETGDRKRALKAEATKGSLPDPNVRTVAVDRNNRIWIGTQKGLVVFSNASNIFDAAIFDAAPIIIDDDGIAKRLLGEQSVNSIAIDGADNKWFGTDTGGALGTNPSGQETLFNFNKDNSPLPSNKIVKIKVDDTNGKVFFATDKGIVAFKNNVAPFGDVLGEVYAYPNPVRKNHNSVTIDGRNGTNLPRGTNVKILDASGRLVHETNVIEGQELKGGKVIWDKRNLAGRKVASGVYIVLLSLPDSSETSTTKIAIIN